MENEQVQDLKDALALQDFRGKPVISLEDGSRIGRVEDILIDPEKCSLEGIVTSRGGFLRSEVRVIPTAEVSLWGQDVVLVHHTDAIRKKGEVNGLETCLSAADDIPGRNIISMSGDIIGELSDLLLTPFGRLAGYEITRVRGEIQNYLSDGRRRRYYTLPVSTLHSFGKDVMVVDLERIKEAAGVNRFSDEPPAAGVDDNQEQEKVEGG